MGGSPKETLPPPPLRVYATRRLQPRANETVAISSGNRLHTANCWVDKTPVYDYATPHAGAKLMRGPHCAAHHITLIAALQQIELKRSAAVANYQR